MSDKIVKNAVVCERLGISDYQRKQMIARGLLEKPIDFGASYPRHTEQQIIRAQRRIEEKAHSLMMSVTKIKPLSPKQVEWVRNAKNTRLKLPD